MKILVKEKAPEFTMSSLLKLCKALEVKNASEILAKISACGKEDNEGKVIIEDLVQYSEIAAHALHVSFKPDAEINLSDCSEALTHFTQINEVISWVSGQIVGVMSSSPN